MSKFRGVVTPLREIPINVAVEIMHLEEFYKPEVYLKAAGDGPYFGVIRAKQDAEGGKFNLQFSLWLGKDEFKSTYLYSKNYNDAMWAGHELPGDLMAFKVLTGAKGREISAAWYDVMMMNKNLPYYGADIGFDPEIFVVRASGDILPAWEFLPAKAEGKMFHRCGKSKCVPYKDFNGNLTTSHTGRAYWDGFQAEFSVNAGPCVSYVVDNVRMGLQTVLDAARVIDPTAQLTLDNVPQIPIEMLENATDTHVGLGCKPSLNAYGAKGQVVENPRALPFRFAGGHVHLGDTKYHNNAPQIVKAIDAIMGVAAVGMFASLDKPVRRRFYGLAGEYRLPAHGLEYRTLSNAWLAHPACMMVVSDMTRDASAIGREGSLNLWIPKYTEERVQSIINNCDVSDARKFVKENELIFKRIAHKRYGSDPEGVRLLQAIYNGFDSLVNFETLNENWMLDKPTDAELPYLRVGVGGNYWISHCESPGRNFSKLCLALNSAAEPKTVAVGA